MADILASVSELLRLAEQLTVPTRIYFPSSGVADLTAVAFDAAWENSVSAVRRQAIVNGRKRGTAAASVNVVGTAANPEQQLHAQYITRPLLAQTISGNVRGQFRALESAANVNGTIQIGIRVVSKDGTTVRGTLLAVGGTTTTTSTPPEFATSLTNRRLLTAGDVTPLPLSSVVCQEGDRLVIEIGHNNKDTSTSRNVDISFGDNTVDLLTDDTTTTAQDPWIEFDTTIAFQDQVEILTLSDTGNGVTQMMNQGWVKADDRSQVAVVLSGIASSLFDKEHVKISDSVTAALVHHVVVDAENLKLAEGPATGLLVESGLSRAITNEVLKLADTPTPALTPEQASASESLKISEDLSAAFVLLVNVSENLKLSDIGQGLTALIGVLHIVDGPPIAALSAGSDLSTSASEALKVVDTVTASRGLTAAVTDETVIVADSVTPAIQWAALVTAETLLLADGPALRTLDPEQAGPAESLKVVDTVTAERVTSLSGTPASEDPIHVVDGPPVGRLDPIINSVSETLKLSDTPSAGLTPLLGSASEALAPADTVSAARQDATNLSATVTAESLKLTDTVSTLLPTLAVQAPTENVKISDKVNIIQASINEQFRLSDTGGGITQLIGTLRIQDIVSAQIGNQLSIAVSETLKLADVLLQPERTPYTVSVSEALKLGWISSEAEYTRDEYVRVQDTVNVSLAAPTDLNTAITQEVLKLADAATMNRDLERAAGPEPLTPADAVTAKRDIDASLTEPITPADSVTAIQDRIAEVVDSLTIADSAAGQVHPEEATPTADALRIQDQPSVNLSNPTDESTSLSDPLEIADSVQVALQLSVELAEAVSLGEVFDFGDGTILTGSITETALLAEEQRQTVDLRTGPEQEDFSITDSIEATLALVVVIDPEQAMAADTDLLQLGLDLAIEVPGDPGPGVSSSLVKSTSEYVPRTTGESNVRTTS